MRVRVVGSSASVPRPGRACTCVLIRTPQARLLVDFGSGALAKLREAIDYTSVDAAVITHMHADHFLDLIPLRYGLKYGPLLRGSRMPLWLPPGGEAQLRAATSIFATDGSRDFLGEVFDVREYDPQRELCVNDVVLRFAKTRHYIDAYAVRADAAGASAVYSSDTAPCEAVEELARGAGVFVCEASLGLGTENGPVRGHLSAAEAGQLAEDAGVRRLVITHYGSEAAPEALLEAACSVYRGPASVADDGTEIDV